MTSRDADQVKAQRAFVAVDTFLQSEIEARALTFALSRGWLDQASITLKTFEQRARDAGVGEQALALLLDLLVASNILVLEQEELRLTPDFSAALIYRDLLEAKLWFANLVAPDVHQLFDALMTDLPQFMDKARVFELFRYDLCLDVTTENLAVTNQWVRYTTILTAYESFACHARLQALRPHRMLDVGGNSGEFARHAVRSVPGLSADVCDLPVVCELGRRHLASTAESDRVRFIPGDLRVDDLPGGYDLVSFKSMLHDWPDEFASDFLRKAVAALEPGGSILIFERAEIRATGKRMPYSMVANLVFLPFFRNGETYKAWLEQFGLVDLSLETVMLEMPFHLITARKPL